VTTVATVDLSKAAIRERAVQFAKRWEGTKSEAAEKQTFWNELLGVFGIDRRQVAAFEELAKRASTGNIGWIDLLYPGQMAVEHKSAGEDLDKALGQLFDYLPALHKAEFPWLLVVSDFERFAWRNLDTGQSGEFALTELPHNLEVFWWMAGHGASPFTFEDEEEANLVATAHMAELYDELLSSGYDAHALREWLTRILFCLFADDTDVWDRAGFHTYVARYTHTDGHDLGPMLAQLFEVLDTPPERRARTLDEDLAAFTYINGDLFANRLPIPSCNESVRNALLEACRFDWSIISPSIFGSMFQNVMQPRERRQLGAHYTTEQNILRTIRPLFLDDLEADLAAANTRPKLERFLDKLPTLRFMDPACGCGNFLVIAYREVRRLETEALRRLEAQRRRTGQRTMTLELLCKVNVAQFFGIEIEEFPARIARTALYLADHIANRAISAEFGELFLRFPIPASPHIEIANALRMDWNDLLPAGEANYVFGNPPFVGKKERTSEQRVDMTFVFAKTDGAVGVLDYVTCWYKKAVSYIADTVAQVAFVSTNSITHGEQPAVLWASLHKPDISINFAHRTFSWSSEARGTAHVHVVIIGFSRFAAAKAKRQIWDYPDINGEPVRREATNINPYLADAPDALVTKRRSPLVAGTPEAREGSKLGDWGHLTLDTDSVGAVEEDPVAAKYLRKLVGADEMLNDIRRWCLWLRDMDPADVQRSSLLRTRLAAVADIRAKSDKAPTKAMAGSPGMFLETRQPTTRYLFLPCVSSSRRPYIPLRFYEVDVIIRTPSFAIEAASPQLFALLHSSMFMAWVRTVSGRIKSDYQIAPGTVYNTFPFPDSSKAEATLAEAAALIEEARSEYPGVSLGVLYDPLSMPHRVREAHIEVDRIVDRIYAPRRRFHTDADRLALLFERYQQLVEGNQLFPPAPRQRRRRAN
jgi:hypothetical protein